MRRLFAALCALALVAPVSAQEQAPQPKQVPAVTNVAPAPMNYEQPRRGLFGRVFNRNRDTVPMMAQPPMTAPATAMAPTTTATTVATMEPMFDRRGRMIGWRPVTTTPTLPPAKATGPTEMPKPAPTTNPVAQASNVETKMTQPPTKVVQAGAIEPMPEQPRRGILSRIFRR